jgi:hypothetical protein
MSLGAQVVGISTLAATKHCRARRTLLCFAFGFPAAQLACAAILEWQKPEFYDPKYGCRLNNLRAEISSEPGRKITIILGSSRSEQGFRPSLLQRDWCVDDGKSVSVSAKDRGSRPVLFYNLARGSSSPLLHLLTLKRLLADGIRPDWLFLEIFPPSLAESGAEVTLAKTAARDFVFLAGHPVSWETYIYYLRDRFALWSRYRSGLLARLDSESLCPGSRWDSLWNQGTGEWRIIGETISEGDFRHGIADARRRYWRQLRELKITSDADRATRALLQLCQDHDIKVLLFLMPEGSEFRRWYTRASQKNLERYLKAICSEYHSPLIDARTWIADEDFWDGHHLLLHGAVAFMARFDAEARQRMTAVTPCPFVELFALRTSRRL